MITSPYDKYRQSSVQTSTPAQLVIMLYDGAIRFVKTALDGLSKQEYEKSNLNFGKAQSIVSELMGTLDHSYEVSKGLFSLYEYTNRLLIEANIHRNPEKGHEALGYLGELRETWLQASKLSTAQNENVHG